MQKKCGLVAVAFSLVTTGIVWCRTCAFCPWDCIFIHLVPLQQWWFTPIYMITSSFNVVHWVCVIHYLLTLSPLCYLFTVCVVCTIFVLGVTCRYWRLLFFDVRSCCASVYRLTILNFRCVFEWEIAYTGRTLYESLADHVREQYMLSTTNNQYHFIITLLFTDRHIKRYL